MSTRIVVCLNHFPLEVMAAGATVEQAEQRCEQLQAEHKARPGVHVARAYFFCTVPEIAEVVE